MRSLTTPAWRLVAAREINVKLRDRNFIISTLTTLAIMAIAFAISFAMAGRESTSTVAYTGVDAGGVVQAMAATGAAADGEEGDEGAASGPAMFGAGSPLSVEPVELPDAAAVENAVASGEADAGLLNEDGRWVLVGEDSVPSEVSSAAGAVIQSSTLEAGAQAAGTSTAQLLEGSDVEERLLAADVEDSDPLVALIASFAFVFLFYMAGALFGYGIASSVIEEKQSRVVEILAASIPLRHLLFGKVIGATALALGQLALILGLAVVGLSFTDYADFLPEVGGAAVWYLVFFVFGFATLAAMFAVAGSLGTRAEDVQSTATPVLMLLMVAAFGGLFLEGTAHVIASYVPVVSTVAMPMRIIDGATAWWEPVIALVVSVVATLAVVALAERIYRRSLLQTSGKLGWKQALTMKD